MRRQFTVGDPVPDFHCPSTNNPMFYFGSMGGRYIVMCFYGSMSSEKNAKAVAFFTKEMRHHFNDEKASFFGISTDRSDREQGCIENSFPGIRYFLDFDGAVSRAYGALDEDMGGPKAMEHHAFTLVLDPSMRVIANVSLFDVEKHNEIMRRFLAALPMVNDHAHVPLYAPVLIIPRVFEPDFCRQLMELYDRHGGVDSGSMVEKDGKTIGKIDYSHKRRMDYNITDQSVVNAIGSRIARRIFPEIYKSFQFQPTRIERYIVACYDGEHKGFFRPHRDNTTKATAHRQFACTINLNADEYEGGDLRFPEFGSRTYRAPTGGAVVFSCSLLHEATPVTRGKRYATLPFLYDETALQAREQNMKYLSDEVMNLNQ